MFGKALNVAANTYNRLASLDIGPAVAFGAAWYVKIRNFLCLLLERFRKIDPKELVLFKLALVGFGFFAGLCAPRKFRKFKIVVLLLSIAAGAAFLYRLLTNERD